MNPDEAWDKWMLSEAGEWRAYEDVVVFVKRVFMAGFDAGADYQRLEDCC